MTGQGHDSGSDPNRELRDLVASVARSVQANSEAIQANREAIAELREGQKMMMQIFQERDARLETAIRAFDQRTEAFERRTESFQQEMQVMRQEIADLRRDFLEFVMRDRDSES